MRAWREEKTMRTLTNELLSRRDRIKRAGAHILAYTVVILCAGAVARMVYDIIDLGR